MSQDPKFGEFEAGRRGLPLEVDPHLAEEAVLRAIRSRSASTNAVFRSERDAIYEIRDPERMEALFIELHGRWFRKLGLAGPILRGVREQPIILEGAGACQVIQARTVKDEGADLFRRPSGPANPVLVIRLRAETLVDEEALKLLLRRELAHVADMLDPEFGYDPDARDLNVDPALENLIRARYRVLWDIRVAGRLCRDGVLPGRAREALRNEFAATFPMLGSEIDAAFRSFFDPPPPTHQELLAFALNPMEPLAEKL